MTDACDILILGTGPFAQRIACDLAATPTRPPRVTIAGRNALRLAWILTAARARAEMFARPVTIEGRELDLAEGERVAELLARLRPAVIAQAASLQPASVIAGGANGWTRLVAEGGLSATAVFQAVLTSRVARATAQASPASQLINCCFPDVVNGIIATMGLPVACGIGNIAILAHAFAGLLEGDPRPKLQLLCHYQNIAAWRRAPGQRSGPAPRVWVDGSEVAAVYMRFAAVQLTPEPVIDMGDEVTGAVLRRIREARGIELGDIAHRTKISERHLRAIEEERFGEMPAAVYVRGYVMEYARAIRIDAQKAAGSYLRRYNARNGPTEAPPAGE